MKTVDLNQVSTADQQLRALGLRPSDATDVREVFTPNTPLPNGEYVPAITGWQKAATLPPRGKNGSAYDALPFKSPTGELVNIGLSAIFNSIRVVDGMKPEELVKDAKWAGEAAQPTKNFFRYGALKDMEKGRFLEGNDYKGAYLPTSFQLAVEVVYVAPRFVGGKPVFDTECELRKAKCVKDYAKFEDTNAQR